MVTQGPGVLETDLLDTFLSASTAGPAYLVVILPGVRTYTGHSCGYIFSHLLFTFNVLVYFLSIPV